MFPAPLRPSTRTSPAVDGIPIGTCEWVYDVEIPGYSNQSIDITRAVQIDPAFPFRPLCQMIHRIFYGREPSVFSVVILRMPSLCRVFLEDSLGIRLGVSSILVVFLLLTFNLIEREGDTSERPDIIELSPQAFQYILLDPERDR